MLTGGNSPTVGVKFGLPEDNIDWVTIGKLLLIDGYNGEVILPIDRPFGAIFLK